MKRLLLSIITLALCAVCSSKTITLSINGIRETEGTFLIMVETLDATDNAVKPVMLMHAVSGHKMEITLEMPKWSKFKVSAFIDTNDNKQIDKDEYGRPTEGFIQQVFTDKDLKKGVLTAKVTYLQ
ncbi:DUF2141 domain-containing protein [Prevotella aurantiaca]